MNYKQTNWKSEEKEEKEGQKNGPLGCWFYRKEVGKELEPKNYKKAKQSSNINLDWYTHKIIPNIHELQLQSRIYDTRSWSLFSYYRC